jgi:antitoxin PrlF
VKRVHCLQTSARNFAIHGRTVEERRDSAEMGREGGGANRGTVRKAASLMVSPARDRLEFVVDEDGRVVVLPASVDASELAGMLKRPAKPVTVEGMNQAIRKRSGRR